MQFLELVTTPEAPLITGGTSTAYTITPALPILLYAGGESWVVKFNAACGNAPTLTVSGVASPPNLVKQNSDGTLSNLSANEIPANWVSRVTLLSATQAKVESLPISNIGASEQSLTQYFYPSFDGNYRDQYRSGWLPAWFNQQWGGSQWGGMPDGSFGSVATCYIQDNNYTGIGSTTNNFYVSQKWKCPENITNPIIWLKLYRVGNGKTGGTSTSTFTVAIYSDAAGSPNAIVGAAATPPLWSIESKTDGEWYPFAPAPGALTAGATYHIVVSTGTSDASHYLVWKGANPMAYPYGNLVNGTSAPVWTANAGFCSCFIVQNPAANALLQSGGMFDYKLAFNNSTTINQSRAVAQPLVNFISGEACSILHRGTYSLSSNVWDFAYGIDHDRITLTINGSGFPVLTVYRSDRTAYTVTGTGSVTSGNHDVGIRVRYAGDGADYATLYVDGVSVGTPLTAQTFTMDTNFKLLGTARLGDGFGLAPTWTQDMQMTALPSTQGWTWNGTGTEANCMSIQSNKLYQNANGYGATQSGFYSKTTGFVNATGWTYVVKCRVPTDQNAPITPGSGSVFFGVNDGARAVYVNLSEYFLQIGGSAADFTVLGDFKSQEHVFVLEGKGNDYYLFMDGKLLVDGTGKLTVASASNAAYFGDGSTTSGINSDAIWSYVKYYQGGMILPIANSGSCSEFAHWSDDKSALFPILWNGGTPQSIKQVCGVPRNYQYEAVVAYDFRAGISNASTSALALLPDMEMYCIGSQIDCTMQNSMSQSGAGYMYTRLFLDGTPGAQGSNTQGTTATGVTPFITTARFKSYCGLHKLEGKFSVNTGTVTSDSYSARSLIATIRS